MSNHEAYIMEQLSHAPDEMSRAYELTLTRMMTASDTPLNIRSVLDLLQDQNKPESLRYACFVMATIWYRHMKDMLNVEDLLHRYGKTFRTHPSFLHYRLLSCVDCGYRKDWREILKQAEENVKQMKNSGARHMFAEFTAMFFESDQMDAVASEREMWLEKATAQINIAVQENPRVC